MNAREELAHDIAAALDESSEEYGGYSDTKSVSWATLDGKWDLRETADHLLKAGYRKPRIITTTEERNALPDMTVVRSSNGVIWERYKDPDGIRDHWAQPTASVTGFPSLPATVLYTPEELS
ncbi:hypothetical protein AAI421_14545 [Rhodococcus aetherivorans]|uniref:hypothetical protein n=1 Tax=Rhodococcus aetherivorans TaxID=191292 RepID=UPI0031E17E4B